MRLDRDAALALEVHRVEHLRFHLARLQRAGQLEKAVGERRLAVIDVRDDREIADAAVGPLAMRGAMRRRLARFERHVALRILGADVVGARPNQPVVRVLLEDVRRPARDAADGENRREQIDRMPSA